MFVVLHHQQRADAATVSPVGQTCQSPPALLEATFSIVLREFLTVFKAVIGWWLLC